MKLFYIIISLIIIFSGCNIPWSLPYDKYDYDFDNSDIKEMVETRRTKGLSDEVTIRLMRTWIEINIDYSLNERYDWLLPNETYTKRKGECKARSLLLAYFIDRYMDLNLKLKWVILENGIEHIFVWCLGRGYGIGDEKNYKLKKIFTYKQAIITAELF